MRLIRLFYSITLVIFMTTFSYSQNLERGEIPEKYKWDNSILYNSLDEWNKDKSNIEANIEILKTYNGKLGSGAYGLFSALRLYFDTYKTYYKLADYAFRNADEDLRINANQSLNQQASTLGTKFNEALSFLNPEIQNIPEEKLNSFFKDKSELEEFKVFINEIIRVKPHTLSEREEQILASAGLITSASSEVYSIFDNAEKPNSKVTLSTGEEVELTSSAYTKYRTVPNRADRELVMKSTFENYKQFQNTIGANYVAKLHADNFYAKNRNYS
ncbi:MAG: oligoendopeptidase F, partial [Ignavibacteria bacterium]|nr:oligoendopeptidase F [Ignavibacteria bacterium]